MSSVAAVSIRSLAKRSDKTPLRQRDKSAGPGAIKLRETQSNIVRERLEAYLKISSLADLLFLENILSMAEGETQQGHDQCRLADAAAACLGDDWPLPDEF